MALEKNKFHKHFARVFWGLALIAGMIFGAIAYFFFVSQKATDNLLNSL